MPAPRARRVRRDPTPANLPADASRRRTIYINSSGHVRYNANNRNMLYTERRTDDKEKKNMSI